LFKLDVRLTAAALFCIAPDQIIRLAGIWRKEKRIKGRLCAKGSGATVPEVLRIKKHILKMDKAEQG
jgi:hypothetical protein